VKIIATYNLKGGVGKTSTAVNLAWLSAKQGARTLLWDLDPQGAATFYFRVKPRVKGGGEALISGKRKDVLRAIRGTDFRRLDLLPADFSYRHLDLDLDAVKKPMKRLARVLEPLRKDYDRVFIDCAPSISVVSDGVFGAADALVVPTVPTTLSLRTLEQIEEHLKSEGYSRKDLAVLPFFSMVDKRRSLHRKLVSHPPKGRYRFLKTSIPYSAVVEKMGTERAPLPSFSSRSNATRAYRDLWKEIKARVG
jgi:chromosome partitioning protein